MGSLSRIQTPALNSLGAELGMRNRLINGAMAIDQRGSAGTPVTSGYSVDRWNTGSISGGTYTCGQVSDAPAGFANSLKYTVTGASTNNDYNVNYQYIEANNCADLLWGTSAGQTMTLSFWVKSSMAGQFNASIRFFAGTGTIFYNPTYTVNAANTWQYVTLVIPAPPSSAGAYSGASNSAYMWVAPAVITTSGYLGVVAPNTWSNAGAKATGTINIASTAGATVQYTGVQLEKGSLATPFEFRPYGTELALCQRYYWRWNCINQAYMYLSSAGRAYSTTNGTIVVQHPVPMRTAPSMNNSNNFAANNWDYALTAIGINNGGYSGYPYMFTNLNCAGTFPGSERVFTLGSGSSTTTTIWIDFSAEL